MVYRGKPSAGCDSCRKSKKLCTLEVPACVRCVRLNKQCSGYRDTTQLHIHDETQAVQLKAERQRVRYAASSKSAPSTRAQSPVWSLTPSSTSTDSSTSNGDSVELLFHDEETNMISAPTQAIIAKGSSYGSMSAGEPLTRMLSTSTADLAVTHFFNRFTSATDWSFLRGYASKPRLDPLIEFTIRACGMAALNNIDNAVMGRDYAQSMYVKALGLLNAALRDSKQCNADESLIAVALLGYYENLTCDSQQSVQSWKAHITGATHLLRLRGKQQFNSSTGRSLFRTTRGQILTHCIWDDIAPQSFLWDWQSELESKTPHYHVLKPADDLAKICYDFAVGLAKIMSRAASDVQAADFFADIDRRMMQWSIDTMNGAPLWQYRDLDVPESPHVWNGLVHAYTQQPVPTVWNTYRSVRILLTRCSEDVCRRLQFTNAEREEQLEYYRRVRRQMTDEICAGVPAQLGHASPAYNTPCVLISAHSAIWPLFFAGNCALDRVGGTWASMRNGNARTSAAFAQLSWIIGRLEYISKFVGLRFAGGIADVLKGDSRIHDDLLADVKGPTQALIDIHIPYDEGKRKAYYPGLEEWVGPSSARETTAPFDVVSNTDPRRNAGDRHYSSMSWDNGFE